MQVLIAAALIITLYMCVQGGKIAYLYLFGKLAHPPCPLCISIAGAEVIGLATGWLDPIIIEYLFGQTILAIVTPILSTDDTATNARYKLDGVGNAAVIALGITFVLGLPVGALKAMLTGIATLSLTEVLASTLYTAIRRRGYKPVAIKAITLYTLTFTVIVLAW